MPPKKMTKMEAQILGENTSGIINFYERMPREMLNIADNPNYHLHHIDLPFRLCLIAPSGSGKTNWLFNLLYQFTIGKKGTFTTINIITQNKDEPLYNYLQSQLPSVEISEGLKSTPRLDDFDKRENHLVVFDDLVLSKDLKVVENYYIRARKLNVSVCFISQSYFLIPKVMRINSSYIVILKMNGDRDLNLILSEYGSKGVDKQTLSNIFHYCTKEKFHCFLIDCVNLKDGTGYRKDFLEVIDISKFNGKDGL
jgi:hypothetical protein